MNRVESPRRRAEGGRRNAAHRARTAGRSSFLAQRSLPRERRGVLLLVVLSMLVLFMLVGTTFLMTSNQYRTAATGAAKADRVVTPPDDLLNRALMQVLRDTDNSSSVVRYHSLLRDLYGTDGFEAVVYSPASGVAFNPSVPATQVTRFAGAIAGTSAEQLGPTQGQFIDIYVRELAYKANDPLTPESETLLNSPRYLAAPDARHVLKPERDASGQPQMLFLPLTKGYYSGCLLTITSGPARGQSARIVDYEYISDIPPTATATAPPSPLSSWPFPLKANTRLFRFRVMAFPRADGLPLQIDADRPPEIGDLAGATFIVNGRPYNGTGVGYNPLAAVGTPRLTAVQRLDWGPARAPSLGAELALLPNSRFFDWNNAWSYNLPQDPFFNLSTTDSFTLLNGASPGAYPSYVGAGDADESYDTADFQNMFLAIQTVAPRSQGWVVQGQAANPVTLDVADPNVDPDEFLRLDLEDLPLPSFHRPALVNFWYHRLLNSPWLQSVIGDDDQRAKAILQPYDEDGNLSPWVPSAAVAAQITALKRQFSLRPLPEDNFGIDNPGFDGSNPQSRYLERDLNGTAIVKGAFPDLQIAIPYWEVVGPWDVDNDNDGVPDSVWVDLGDPVQAAEDGTRYKPLYAFLIVDLDSRLNLNAHGLVEHVYSPFLDPTGGAPGNLAHDLSVAAPLAVGTSDVLPQGIGYGPAEISLRPVFPAPLTMSGSLSVGNRLEDFSGDGVRSPTNDYPVDDYATLLGGRVKTGDTSGNNRPLVTGRHGIDPWPQDDVYINDAGVVTLTLSAAAGITSFVPGVQIGPPDLLTMYEFFGYPESVSNYVAANYVPNSFTTPPDLMGSYALGIDYVGQPAYEYMTEGNAIMQAFMAGNPLETVDRPLVADSPYELDLSGDRRRDTRADDRILRINMLTGTTDYLDVTGTIQTSVVGVANDTDDAPFATADLERVLRAYDADAGALPSRLWDVVGAFDPLKLFQDNPYRVQTAARFMFNDSSLSATDEADEPQMLVAAQQISAVNRRLVTTDSYDLPVPGGGMPSYASELGPDGAPGRLGVDDDPDGSGPLTPNGTVDDATEIGAPGSDDFQAVTGTPFGQATIVDLLHYRVFLELRKRYIEAYVMNYVEDQSWTVPLTPAQETQLSNALRTNLNTQTATIQAEADTVNQGLAQVLLAPEVIAGQRMDLNRPFGDGRDNNGNGIVDEPLEAGEPFVDLQDAGGNPVADGKYQPGESFADLDLNSTYSYPIDELWQGLTAEPISFDYRHGDYQTPVRGRLRDNGVLQRQVFARQLYVLMMLLVDDAYLETQNVLSVQSGNINVLFLKKELASEMALRKLMDDGIPIPPDPNDRQELIQAAVNGELFTDANGNRVWDIGEPWTDTIANGQYDPPMEELAIPWALRKLTARRIAQWAINCVDFRDADAIMTPFEYDENPFDGWNCAEYDRSTGLLTSAQPLPIDGDLATNENWGNINPAPPDPPQIDEPPYSDDDFSPARVNGVPRLIPGVAGAPPTNPGAGVVVTIGAWQQRVSGLSATATREVVWGTERPELLITETVALHDRRATDEGGPGSIPTNYSIFDQPQEGEPPDLDLDQRLKPRGSLFVELYNPWSPDSTQPAEFYGTPSGPGTDQGVMLNRLSDVGVRGKRSPVWRLTVLRDPIGGRLTDQTLQLLQVDPDGFGADMDRDAERWIYFTTGDDYRTPKAIAGDANDESDANRDDDNYIAGTGVGADYELVGATLVPEMDNLKVRVPPRPYRIARNPQTNQDEPYATARRYFIARTERVRATALRNDTDVPIAPILPGRYAVVGSSGLQLAGTGISGNSTLPTGDGQTTTRFVTSLSRLPGTASDEQSDRIHRQLLGQTRRIELWPLTNPNAQQVLMGENGGQEFARFGASFANVTDSDQPGSPNFGVPGLGVSRAPLVDTNGDGAADYQAMEACVAIPVEDMNISEPTEGYPSLLYQQEYYDQNQDPLNVVEAQLNTEGDLEYSPPYDRPLDMEFDLVRNGTTQKYRTLHLQRLANPMLPWNPAPPNVLYQASLPVNPYRTIDSQSVDLTAYNGASEFERNMLPTTEAQTLLGISTDDLTQQDVVAPLPVAELVGAPNHVLWAIIYLLQLEGIQLPVDARTPDGFREMVKGQPDTVEGYLTQLENKKGGNPTARANLLEDRSYVDSTTNEEHRWDGEWGWHLFRRVLPEDYLIPGYPPGTQADFRQRLNLKSLERGADYLGYLPATNWRLDLTWVPRLLWKQERPNFMLLLPGQQRVSDLKNVRSRRVLRGGGTPLPSDYRSADDALRSQFYQNFGTASGLPVYASGMFDVSNRHVFDYVLENTLGFTNEAYAPELDRTTGDQVAIMTTQRPGAPEIVNQNVVAAPEQAELNQWNPSEAQANRLTNYTPAQEQNRRRQLVQSTYPWLAWNDRPLVSADEIMQVPAASSSLMLRDYSVISSQTPSPYDGDGVVPDLPNLPDTETPANRVSRQQGAFGHLLNFFLAADRPAGTYHTKTAAPEPLSGAPNYYRILDYVEVPSRYVGTDTLLNPGMFVSDITGPDDPRYAFQPPFNKVSRQRDPGRVNLNTVVGRREIVRARPSWSNEVLDIPHIWSEVYDGIMHRYQDGNPSATQLGQFGPAWRDAVLSRRGYAQFNADAASSSVDKPGVFPDTLTFGLNRNFPTFFANPFRSPDAGDLVPLVQLQQYGVDASWLRVHPRTRGNLVDDDGNGVVDDEPEAAAWGDYGVDDDGNGLVDDMREAGYHQDEVSRRGNRAIPEEEFDDDDRDAIPLFSETTTAASIDATRNPYMMYQPMTRLGNLVTTRSGVFGIWITVGYFEVESAPDWNLPAVRERFGGDPGTADPTAATNVAARALYDRVYPEGYMLGREMGIDTGEVKRQRALFIIDRTEPAGFKPGEDLNVEDMIRVRRRIE